MSAITSSTATATATATTSSAAATPSYQVLLFYKYTPIADPPLLCEEQKKLCEELQLTGRLRIAKEGLNGNLGGTKENINKYMNLLTNNSRGDFTNIDFKLSGVVENSSLSADEQKMSGLIIKVTKELVSLGPGGMNFDAVKYRGGQHLSPEEFHAMLTKKSKSGSKKEVVLLDTRNIYETRIGGFRAPGVETIDPETRQFSDLPRRLQDPLLKEKLKGKQILMYCTGGVRCERASALLQSQGEGFEQVYQLSGGIHRYVEKYGKDGCFNGKNFVFDDRMAAPADEQICGTCSVCDVPFDDYTVGCRCNRCRLRILVCRDCHAKQPNAHHVCELCVNIANEGRLHVLGMNNVNEPRRVTHVGDIVCFHDVSGSRKSCMQQMRRIQAKLKNYATFRYLESTLKLYQYHQTVPVIERERDRFTWFGDCSTTEPLSDGKRFRVVHTSATILMNVLDAVTNAWPFDGILGIGEGANAAAIVSLLVGMDNTSLENVFTTIMRESNGSEEYVQRVKSHRTCIMSMRAATIAATTSTTSSAATSSSSTSTSDSSSSTPLLYTIFINGQVNQKKLLNVLSLQSVEKSSMPYMVPTLHLNVRTKQQRIMSGIQSSYVSYDDQEKCVQELYDFYVGLKGPNTFITAVDDNGEKEYSSVSTIKVSKKRRKLENGSSKDVSLSTKVMLQQPGSSIRNFACIDGMRTFLHRTTLQVQEEEEMELSAVKKGK